MRSDGRDVWETDPLVVAAVAKHIDHCFVLDAAAELHSRKAPFHLGLDAGARRCLGNAMRRNWAEAAAEASDFIQEARDEFPDQWFADHAVWLNPPFSELADGAPWLQLAAECAREGFPVATILPVSLAKWFRSALPNVGRLLIPNRRIEYRPPAGIAASGANFDSWVLVFDDAYYHQSIEVLDVRHFGQERLALDG